MEYKELKLRERANIERYIHKDMEACANTIMELYNCIPSIGGDYKNLFRYRSLNSYELDALENETLFMRWPSSYDDENDCTPVLNFKEITEFIVKQKYPYLNAEKVTEKLIDMNDIKKNPRFKEKIADLRNMWMIACFTERYNNSKMWETYADNNKGICLIYDFLDILKKIKDCEDMSIMPVRYVDNRDQCAEICLNHKDLLEVSDETEAKYRLTCTTKERSDYSFEEEWRLIYEREKTDIDGKKIGDNIPFMKPKMIICGSLVDKKSLEYQRLINIAEEKKIKVLCM